MVRGLGSVYAAWVPCALCHMDAAVALSERATEDMLVDNPFLNRPRNTMATLPPWWVHIMKTTQYFCHAAQTSSRRQGQHTYFPQALSTAIKARVDTHACHLLIWNKFLEKAHFGVSPLGDHAGDLMTDQTSPVLP